MATNTFANSDTIPTHGFANCRRSYASSRAAICI